MRASILALGILSAAAAWSASAQPASDAARQDFQAELGRQCPDKQLQMLSERDLSDGLDDYKQSLSDDIRGRFQLAEQAQCASLNAGVACVNGADLGAADETGRIADLAGAICSSFLRCRDQGDCDYAR